VRAVLRHVQILALASWATLASAIATAEELDGGVPAEPWGSERVLGGHLFQYPTLTQSAFLASTLNFQVLFTYNATKVTPLGNATTTSVQQAAPLVNTELTLHVADPVSIFFNLTGAFASGVTASSLVLKGESLSYALRGGAIVRLLRDAHSATQVALVGSFRYAGGSSANLRGLVRILQGNSNITPADVTTGAYSGILFTPFNSYDGTASGAVAHAFAPWLSLQAALGLTVNLVTSDPFDVVTLMREAQSQVNTTPTGAVALTFDANSFHVPLALQAEYRLGISWVSTKATTLNPSATTTNSFSNAFDLGFFYSGRSDLQAGIVAVAFVGAPPVGALGPGNPGDTQNGFGAILTMRYVW
jgi:hypothetical protein